MTLQLSPTELAFFGPALPEAFVQHELEGELGKGLPSVKEAAPAWEALRRALHTPLLNAGAVRVRNVLLAPLAEGLGYSEIVPAEAVATREGAEPGGYLLRSPQGERLRAWSYAYETDLDAAAPGLNPRYSPLRVAERVLLASGERLGLLTNGLELRLVFSDPARRASFAAFALSAWKRRPGREPAPDAFRLLLAFAAPQGLKRLPEVIEAARLKQGQVTKDLRQQARRAVEGFIQGLLEHPANRAALDILRQRQGDAEVARQLWHDALILVYRLLFILRGESGGADTPPFAFASSSLWRNSYSPSRYREGSLAWAAEQLNRPGGAGLASGAFLESGLRALFRLFEQGVQTPELHIAPLGGALFGPGSIPLAEGLAWGEGGCAALLDNLLRAPRGQGRQRSLQRISYRDLDVEELGRVYEALLELEPGIAGEGMCRLRRAKLEVVVPAAQGEKYRPAGAAPAPVEEAAAEEAPDEDEAAAEESGGGKKTKIEWIEAIPAGRFYLRVGLGRKSSGSYYTPESFVRFLVQETLGPLCAQRSPAGDPQPRAILKLNVLDPAMGSGHFLVGACRFLGERLYEACRAAAELGLWERIPDEISPYLPGRRPEGESESGFSAGRALALCRRLAAVHCLYGVDKNPLAVELAKVSLWLESFAEGLPLTFLDHRLACGDSLLGPLNLSEAGKDSPFTPPYSDTPLDAALTATAREALRRRLALALEKVAALDATLGMDAQDLQAKALAKAELDAALRPFVDLCTAWSGGIMLGPEQADGDAYRQALELTAAGRLPEISDEWLDGGREGEVALPAGFLRMLTKGRAARVLVFPLAFPEVFYPADGQPGQVNGFDVVLGNPPWDAIQFKTKEFLAAFDFEILNAPTMREREVIEKRVLSDSLVSKLFSRYQEGFEEQKRANDQLYQYQKVYINGDLAGRQIDSFRVFMERDTYLLGTGGVTGIVVPSAFYSNEGATGVRQLYLYHMNFRCCYSFENRRLLFDIHRSFKFAVILATRGISGQSFPCAFYLHDDGWLFTDAKLGILVYSLEFIKETGGDYLSFLELSSPMHREVAQNCFSSRMKVGPYLEGSEISLITSEMHMTHDSHLFEDSKRYFDGDVRNPENIPQLISTRLAILHEGKTTHQYNDRWGVSPRYVVKFDTVNDRWKSAIPFYRLGYRSQARSNDERTAIFTVLPPLSITSIKFPSDITPQNHPVYHSLSLVGIGNSFTFDFCLRQMVAVDVSLFILKRMPLPQIIPYHFISHSALRLICNHSGYEPLWNEQLGNEWREISHFGTYPVLAGEDARWEVRAAIDAVVAQAYGLSRGQYAHVLSTFSHKSYPRAPELCLAKFDELAAVGLEAFTRKYDPYWDVPLVESLPEPVIELPALTPGPSPDSGRGVVRDMFGEVVIKNPKRGRKRK